MLTEAQINDNWKRLSLMGVAMVGGFITSATAMYYWQDAAAAMWYIGFVVMYWGYRTNL